MNSSGMPRRRAARVERPCSSRNSGWLCSQLPLLATTVHASPSLFSRTAHLQCVPDRSRTRSPEPLDTGVCRFPQPNRRKSCGLSQPIQLTAHPPPPVAVSMQKLAISRFASSGSPHGPHGNPCGGPLCQTTRAESVHMRYRDGGIVAFTKCGAPIGHRRKSRAKNGNPERHRPFLHDRGCKIRLLHPESCEYPSRLQLREALRVSRRLAAIRQ